MAEMFGRYRLDDRLGQGGMGVVYRGWDPVLQRVIALKMVLASSEMDSDVRERFFREARAAAQLTHKNIVTVYDLGEQEGRPFLAMEFLDGEDLQRRLARPEKMGFWRKVDIAIEMCQGIEFAHAHGVIHRDLKPANIFISTTGGVKILDFGLARFTSSQLTQSNMMMGTLNYMSPEQVRGERADQQSDVFSMGVVLYELFGGRRAFEGDSAASTLYKILQEVPEPLWKIDAAVPRELTAIIDHALGKLRDERYPDMASLRHDLETLRNTTHLGGPSTSPPFGSAPPFASAPTVLTPRSDATQLIAPTVPPMPAPAVTPVPTPAPSGKGSTARSFLVGATIGALALAVFALWKSNRVPESAPTVRPTPTASVTPTSVPAAPPTIVPIPAPQVTPTPPAATRSASADNSAPRPVEARNAGGRPSRRQDAADAGAPGGSGTHRTLASAEPPPPAAPVEARPSPPPSPAPSSTPALPAASQAPPIVSPAVTVPAPPTPTTVPPAPAPAASAAPATGPPVLNAERAADLLRRYRAALEARSLDQLKRIWPSLSGNAESAMRQQFEQAARISVETSEPQVSVSGSTGRLLFVRNYSVVTVEGRQLQSTAQATMDVHRSGDTWVIDAIRFVSR